MSELAYERMRDSLEQLHLGRALETVDSLLDRAAGGEIRTVDLLDQLLGAELAVRRERSIAMRLKLAGLPAVKTLEQFDFAFQPSLDQEKIRDLHTLRFMASGHNVILLGPPGCGKTHLGTSLGHAAITAGELVHFTTARELFAKLRSPTSANAQFKRLAATRARLLIINEIGYEPLDHLAATHFFRVICERYERGSIRFDIEQTILRMGRTHWRRDTRCRNARPFATSCDDDLDHRRELPAQRQAARRRSRSY